MRVFINKRDKLEKDCELCVNELCTLDESRIKLDNLLTVLTHDEMIELEVKLRGHLGVMLSKTGIKVSSVFSKIKYKKNIITYEGIKYECMENSI